MQRKREQIGKAKWGQIYMLNRLKEPKKNWRDFEKRLKKLINIYTKRGKKVGEKNKP